MNSRDLHPSNWRPCKNEPAHGANRPITPGEFCSPSCRQNWQEFQEDALAVIEEANRVLREAS